MLPSQIFMICNGSKIRQLYFHFICGCMAGLLTEWTLDI